MTSHAYLTPTQLAALLEPPVDRSTVVRWCNAGRIPGAVKLGPRAWLIPADWRPDWPVTEGWPKGKPRKAAASDTPTDDSGATKG
jgi:hypothetical protein